MHGSALRAVVAAVAVLSVTAPAAGAAGWASPQTVAAKTADESSVTPGGAGIDDAGTATALVARHQGVDDASNWAAQQAPGGAWSALEQLPVAGPNGTWFAENGAGAQVAAVPDNGFNKVTLYYRPAGGSWSAGHLVDRGAATAGLVIDARGNAVFTSADGAGNPSTPWAVTYRAATGAWTPAVDLAIPGNYGRSNLDHELAVDGHGHVFLVWSHETGLDQSSIELVTGSIASGTWTPVQVLATVPARNVAPAIGAGQNGGLTVVWNSPRDVVGIERASLGAAFGPVRTLAARQKPADLAVAEDAAGDATLVWMGQKKAGYPIRSIHRLAGDPAWSAVETVAASSSGFGLTASGADADGGAVVTYEASDLTQAAAVKPAAGGAWSAPATIFPGPVLVHTVAVNAAGAAVVEAQPLFGSDTVSAVTYSP